LTVCDTLKACYLVNIKTRAEIQLDGTDTLELDPGNADGYSVRCDVNGVDELHFIKFFYNGAVQDEYGLPRYMYGDSEEGAFINKVEYLSTCGSKLLKIEGHVWSNLCFEKEYMIEVTNAGGKPCNDKDPTAAPVKAPTNAPVKPPTNAPVKPPTNAPVKPPTNAPVKPRTNAPVKPPTNAPVKPRTNAPVKIPTNAPIKAPINAPIKAPINAPVKPPASAPVKPPTKAPVKSPTPVCPYPQEWVNGMCKNTCKNNYVCPANSCRTEHRLCFDSFDDCTCKYGYYKSTTEDKCIPVKPLTNAPVKPPTKAPAKSPTPVCPYPQEWVNGVCKNTCKNNYVCPSNSCRTEQRLCYDSFDDCSCKHGYYKSTTEAKCIRHSWCYW
jgi:hypothetical protein